MDCILPKKYGASLVDMGVFTAEQLVLMERVFHQVCVSCKIGAFDKERRQTLALGILRNMRWGEIEAALHALGPSVDEEVFISMAIDMGACRQINRLNAQQKRTRPMTGLTEINA
jgi:hypothetical protein